MLDKDIFPLVDLAPRLGEAHSLRKLPRPTQAEMRHPAALGLAMPLSCCRGSAAVLTGRYTEFMIKVTVMASDVHWHVAQLLGAASVDVKALGCYTYNRCSAASLWFQVLRHCGFNVVSNLMTQHLR